MKIKLALALAVVPAALIFAGFAIGGQPQPVVPPHQHYVVSKDGTGTLVPVGPDACSNGMSVAFDNFHFNVHRGQPFANGIISFSGCPS